jgi:hypothetical protein
VKNDIYFCRTATATSTDPRLPPAVNMPGPALVMAVTLLARGKKQPATDEPSKNVSVDVRPSEPDVHAEVLVTGLIREQAELVREQAQRIADLERRLGSLETPRDPPAPAPLPPTLLHPATRKHPKLPRDPIARELSAFHTVNQGGDSEQLVPLFTVSTGSPIRALALSRHIVYQGSPRLLAAADAKGNLWMFNRSGKVLLAAPLGHAPASSVVGLAIGSRDDPFIASATMDGHIRIHNMSLPVPLRRSSSRFASSSGASRTDQPEAPASLVLDVATQILGVDPEDDSAARRPASPIVSLEVYTRRRKTQLLVTDARGTLFTVARNGTVLRSLDLGSPASATARSGSIIAIATTNALVLVDLSKIGSTPTTCESSRQGSAPSGDGAFGEITSLAFDLELPQLLYAATGSGEVLVFNTRTRTRPSAERSPVPDDGRASSACRLVERLLGHQPSALALAAVRGYLLSASPSLLAAHNVSGLYSRFKQAPEAVYARPLGKHSRSRSAAAVLSAASPTAISPLSSTPPSPPLVAVAFGPSGTLTLFSSRLPYERDKPDGFFGGSFGSPLLLAIAITAVFYSLAKAWRVVTDMGSTPVRDLHRGMPPGFEGMMGVPGEQQGFVRENEDLTFLKSMPIARPEGRGLQGQPLGTASAAAIRARYPRAHSDAGGMDARRHAGGAKMESR